MYGSNEKDNQRGCHSRKAKAKNKMQKNTKIINSSKLKKKPEPAKSEKPTAGLVEAVDSTKIDVRNRRKKKKAVGDFEDERLCSFVNFSDIEKHSLIISDSPPIETDLQPVETTPKRTNCNPCSAASEHQQDEQLPVNARPIPVHCSTPHVDGQPMHSRWVEKEKLKMPSELCESVSFLSEGVSRIQLSQTNCSLLSNQNENRDHHHTANCNNSSNNSDTSSLLRDSSFYQSAKNDWSLTNPHGMWCSYYSFIPDISITPLQVHYYSETLPTIDTVSELTRRSAIGNCE